MSQRRRASATMLLTFVIVLVSECKGTFYPAPPNWARLDCPPYTVAHSDKDFEIRSYKDALWVSAPPISSKSYTVGSNEGFLILFGYYNRINAEYKKINMTSPVLVDIRNSTYNVYFYVPKEYQNGGLPKPLNRGIGQVKLPKHKYAAVRRFGGFITESNIPTQVAALRTSLKGTPYERAVVAARDRFTIAGYNSPFEFVNRVNEVFLWFD